MNGVNKVKEIIEKNLFMSLATSDKEGNVWSCPMTFTYDDDYNFYFFSLLDSEHIQNIAENPFVSFAIYSTNQTVADMDGVQGRGVVGQVDDSELEKVHSLFFSRTMPNPEMRAKFALPVFLFKSEDFPQMRFFKMSVTELYKKDIELPIHRRKTIDINELSAAK